MKYALTALLTLSAACTTLPDGGTGLDLVALERETSALPADLEALAGMAEADGKHGLAAKIRGWAVAVEALDAQLEASIEAGEPVADVRAALAVAFEAADEVAAALAADPEVGQDIRMAFFVASAVLRRVEVYFE